MIRMFEVIEKIDNKLFASASIGERLYLKNDRLYNAHNEVVCNLDSDITKQCTREYSEEEIKIKTSPIKYYELMIYANNPVGANFCYCTTENLQECIKTYQPNSIDEISKEEYDKGLETQHRKFLRFVTGYPK